MPGHTAPVEPLEITAGRLHLRPWRAGDEPAVLAACTDPETVRWTNVEPDFTRERAHEYVTAIAPAGWASGEDLCFAVCDSTTAQVLANVALRPTSRPGTYDVGYWCLPSARGQGVVPEALGALCRWGFAALGAQRIEWQAHLGNWASRRVAEKVGFRVEGSLRKGVAQRGTLVDGWLGALLPDDPQEDTAAFPPYPDRTDGVVTLRRWRASDAKDVHRACQDPEIARWLPVPVPYPLEAAQGYVGGIVPHEWAEGSVANCAVTDAADGSLLGAVGLTVRGSVGEVGYWVAPWARGRGLAARAARLHAGWGFEALGMARVELLADVENVASQRAAEKAGWVREGVARSVRSAPREPGRRVDMVVFARLPSDP